MKVVKEIVGPVWNTMPDMLKTLIIVGGGLYLWRKAIINQIVGTVEDVFEAIGQTEVSYTETYKTYDQYTDEDLNNYWGP